MGGRGEDLRAEEWKADVPTIGWVYDRSRSHVVCYLSGQGRPFSLKENDLESDTCWFRTGVDDAGGQRTHDHWRGIQAMTDL